MSYREWLLEALKVVAPIAVAYIGLLRTRTDLDRYIAAKRARDLGKSPCQVTRRRWFHKFFRGRKPVKKDIQK